jgi:hypothetical protein
MSRSNGEHCDASSWYFTRFTTRAQGEYVFLCVDPGAAPDIDIVRTSLTATSVQDFDFAGDTLVGFTTSGPDANGYVYLNALLKNGGTGEIFRTAHSGTGSGFSELKSGIGYGACGDLLGGWVKGDEYGLYVSGRRYALYLDGNTYTNGCIATLHKEDNRLAVQYALTGTSVNILCSGRGRLANGRANIMFAEDFSRSVSDDIPIVIIATAIGECKAIVISDISRQGFQVCESENGDSNNEFNWLAVGTRRGYESTDIPDEIVETAFDENMAAVAFNENRHNGTAGAMWFDGNSLQFGALRSIPEAKHVEQTEPVKSAELRRLEEKLQELKKEIRGLEQEIEKINTQSSGR